LMAFVLSNSAWREKARIVASDFAARRFTWDQATDRLLQAVGIST